MKKIRPIKQKRRRVKFKHRRTLIRSREFVEKNVLPIIGIGLLIIVIGVSITKPSSLEFGISLLVFILYVACIPTGKRKRGGS